MKIWRVSPDTLRENTFKFAFLFIFAVWWMSFHLPSFTTREYDCLVEKLVNTYRDGKEKKITDSFRKRIKIYTVKLPSVSDRKNAKISYVVAYENQTTWGMYRENLTHLREVLITEFWLANRMFFFCLSGRSLGGVRQKNVVKYIKTSYSDVQWTRILFVVLNLENLYRLHRKRQSSRVQIVNTLTYFSAILG